MNNIQLYLSIGVPTFAVLLAWLSNRSDINRLADRIDKLTEQQHKDAMMLQSYIIPLHERMARLEHSN